MGIPSAQGSIALPGCRSSVRTTIHSLRHGSVVVRSPAEARAEHRSQTHLSERGPRRISEHLCTSSGGSETKDARRTRRLAERNKLGREIEHDERTKTS